MGDAPEACTVYADLGGGPQLVNVYAHSAPSSTVGAFFRLGEVEGSPWWSGEILPEHVLSVTPAPGVTILGGDPVNGMTVTWPEQPINHTHILTIEFVPGFAGYFSSRDIVFLASGGSFEGEDVVTLVDYSFPHCTSSIAQWEAPNTVDVGINATTTFTLKAIIISEAPFGGEATISDSEGWVTGLSTNQVPNECVDCPWDWVVIEATVFVPDDVAPETTNTVTFTCFHFGSPLPQTAVVELRAVEPVAVQPSTFGRLKALYRKKQE
jgi:hypothetical protein